MRATPNRLSHHDYHNCCCTLEAEADVVKHLSIVGVVAFIKEHAGYDVTPAQAREMMDRTGIQKADRELELYLVIRAMAKRLNWSWASLVTEGRKIVESEDLARVSDAAKSPPLKENVSERGDQSE